MKWFKRKLKQTLALSLAAVMFFGSADWTVLNVSAEELENQVVSDVEEEVTEDTDETVEGEQGELADTEEVLVEEVQEADLIEYETIECEPIWIEASPAETSAIAMSMYSLDDGQVGIKSTNEVKWIDRLDLTGADQIREFYNDLIEGSDNDGIEDFFIADSFYTGEASSVPIIEITGPFDPGDDGQASLKATLSKTFNNYYPYIIAAKEAFDRDCPEVFWLSGIAAVGATGKAEYNSELKGYYYTVTISMTLKNEANGFDVRAVNYQNEETIKAAISNVNTQATALLDAVSGLSDYEKLRYFNDWLTKNNEYNTSADLDNIGHDCRECTGALQGKTGMEGPVCEAYARAFKVLCDRAEIPCVLVDGYAYSAPNSTGEAHMWNYVQLNGNWYGVDVTWNDPMVYGVSGAISGREGETYLLVGSDTVVDGMEFIASHPVENTVSQEGISFINGPELSKDEYVQSEEPVIIPILYNNAELKDIYTEDVVITAAGYTISETANGTYYPSYTISEEGKPVTKTLYFKQDTTGFITDGKEISVNIDKTLPEILNLGVVEGTLKETSASLRFTATEAGTYYYKAVKKGETAPTSISDFSESAEMIVGDENTITLSGLTQNTDYVVYVMAVDASGNATAAISSASFKTQSSVFKVTLVTNGGKITSNNITSYTSGTVTALPTSDDIVKKGYEFAGWFEDKECEGSPMSSIPDDSTGDKTFYAKWKRNIAFTARINDKDGVVTLPYNTVTKTWEAAETNIVLESPEKGIIINEAYYDKAAGDEYNSLEFNLYKINERQQEVLVGTYTNTYDFTVNEAGKYKVVATYTHPGQEPKTLKDVTFAAEYEAREYPVNKNITWTGVSNLETGLKFGQIKEEIKELLLEDVHLNEDIEGETPITDGTVVIKDSKGKVVSDRSAVKTGTYSVIYKIGENERFLPEATAALKLTYSSFTNAGVDYKVLVENSEDGTKEAAKLDTEGRIPGKTIAYVADNGINATQYTSNVVMEPLFNTPWGVLNAEELQEKLADAFGEGVYRVEVTAEESVPKRKAEFLDFDENTTGVTVTATGEGTGARTVTLTSNIIKNGKTVLSIVSKNHKITVVDGGTNAVKDINIVLQDKSFTEPEKVYSDKDGVVSYLLVKSNASRNYQIKVTTEDYAEKEFKGKLTWKTSNSKLAKVSVSSKTGEITLNVPKNAQGVVDITATAKDAGKKSVSFKLIIVDTEIHQDTTSLTLNSWSEENGNIHIYPNIVGLRTVKGIDMSKYTLTAEIVDRVKVGKKYEYVSATDSLFELTGTDGEKANLVTVDWNKGQIPISLKNPAASNKAKSYTVYLKLTQRMMDDAENTLFEGEQYIKLQVKDQPSSPKMSGKLTVNYNAACYDLNQKSYAEVVVTIPDWETVVEGKLNTPSITTSRNSKFEVCGVEPLYVGNQWSVKLALKEGNENLIPKANKTKKSTVELLLPREGYREASKVNVNVTLTNKLPEMKVYGADVYKPTFYTDLNHRDMELLISVPEEMVNTRATARIKNGVLTLGDTEIALTGSNKSNFEIVTARYSNHETTVNSKGISEDVGPAIVITVRALKNSSGNVQFTVKDSGHYAGTVKTKTLKLNAAKFSNEKLALKTIVNSTATSATSFTFQKAQLGKEKALFCAELPKNFVPYYQNGAYNKTVVKVEGADKNGQALLNNGGLLVEITSWYDISITATEKAFETKYKNAKLKFTMETRNGSLKSTTKSTTVTINFKESLKPSITLTAKSSLNVAKYFYSSAVKAPYNHVTINAKLKDIPAGATICDVRFADEQDDLKYEIVDKTYLNNTKGSFELKQKDGANIPLGKDKIGIIYSIRTMGGEVMEVNTSVTLNVVQSASVKANVKSINLYNSSTGESYGKDIVFYETKGVGYVEDVEILTDLSKYGIEYTDCVTDEDGKGTVRFYTTDDLNRGIEKTYTVKAKVTLRNAGLKKNVPVTYTVSFKINLKK